MNPSDLVNLSVRELCELFRSGNLPEHFKDLSLTEIVHEVTKDTSNKGGYEGDEQHQQLQVGVDILEEGGTQQGLDEEQEGFGIQEQQGEAGPHGQQEMSGSSNENTFQWREKLPNSNNTNPPILLWRGDENCNSTIALAFGIYEDEFKEISDRVFEVEVKNSNEEPIQVRFDVDLDFPKDEKLSRKHAGLAGSGSDHLCTYCSQSRKNVKDPPFSGSNPVTLTNTLLREASHYCQLNPSRKSQEQISKVALGVKDAPLSSTEPKDERPDALHLDINVTNHLVKIASRLFHHKVSGQPLKYEKAGIDKNEMESNEALYFKFLRQKIATLPELTQCPDNFFREYLDEANKDFVREPLPDIHDTMVWNDLMCLWRKMRGIHKSNRDPTDDEINQFKSWVIEFQEKIFSLKWVPVANQIHRLSHIAFFMQTKPIRSIGAYSLEGLEHGNFSTKDGERRRIWKGDSKEGNRQLFRLLRLQGSPTLRRAALMLEAKKRKKMKCSKCHLVGHTKASSKCRFFGIGTVEPETAEIVAGGDEIPSDEDDGQDYVTSSDEEIIETTVVLDDDEVDYVSSSDEEIIETTLVLDDGEVVVVDDDNQCTTS